MPYYRVILNDLGGPQYKLEMQPEGHVTTTSHMIYLEGVPGDCATIAIWTPDNSACSGSSITIYSFIVGTELPSGIPPVYQWYVNGVPVPYPSGTGETLTYTPIDQDEIYCTWEQMAEGSPCGIKTSNKILMNVSAKLTPTISIDWVISGDWSTPTKVLCAGTECIYTATYYDPWSESPYPTFQWYSKTGLVWEEIVGETRTTMTYTPIDHEQISCVLTPDPKITCITSPPYSDSVTMHVTANVIVSVDIVASSGVCSGTTITYSAIPTNGGGTPHYKWYVNDAEQAGETLVDFLYTPSNNDVISVKLTSNVTCALVKSVYGYKTAIVKSYTAVDIEIDSYPNASYLDPDDPSRRLIDVITGDPATFHVISSYTCPKADSREYTYQWHRQRGMTIYHEGTNSPNFSVASPVSGDIVWCTLSASTSDCPCITGNPATSREIIINVVTTAEYSVYILPSPSNYICSGDSVTFTAYPCTTYNTPYYQWVRNGSNVGSCTTTNTYTSSTFVNGNTMSCLCGEGNCSTNQSIAEPVTMNVTTTVTPTVTVAQYPSGTQCYGTQLTFYPSGGPFGTAPSYQWYKNNSIIVGATGSSYTTVYPNFLSNGDLIKVNVYNINVNCASPTSVTSANITVSINTPGSTRTVTIAADLTCFKVDETITFTATPSVGTPSPTYKWYILPSTTPSYTTNNVWVTSFDTLVNRTILCEMTYLNGCSVPVTVDDSIDIPACRWIDVDIEITILDRISTDVWQMCSVTAPMEGYNQWINDDNKGALYDWPYIQQVDSGGGWVGKSILITKLYMSEDFGGKTSYMFYLTGGNNVFSVHSAADIIITSDGNTIYHHATIGLGSYTMNWYEAIYFDIFHDGTWALSPVSPSNPDGLARWTTPIWPRIYLKDYVNVWIVDSPMNIYDASVGYHADRTWRFTPGYNVQYYDGSTWITINNSHLHTANAIVRFRAAGVYTITMTINNIEAFRDILLV